MSDLKFKVTVEYICPNMIDAESLAHDFNNDAFECYKSISDDLNDSPYNFSNKETVIKVEVIK
jgi:hypothetical protein